MSKGLSSTQKLLNELNSKYAKLHHEYEKYFWIFYMGDHSVSKQMDKAKKARDFFRSDRSYVDKIDNIYKNAESSEKQSLKYWKLFFGKYQIPAKVLNLKHNIDRLESSVHEKIAKQKEGYIDPKTKKFIKASRNKMRTVIRTHDDEKTRKACFNALEKLSTNYIKEYIQLVNLRNQFAKELGYEDFYAYKLDLEEGMTKEELFSIFDEIYDKTKYAFKNVRKLEQKKPELRYPWNFSYLMSGDFVREDDPYFQFDESLTRWGRSFAAIGIDFRGSTLQLDLLDREGKYNNGFCHWPELVQYKNGQRVAGSSNFTCNAIFGQIGSGVVGMNTLFHEGGHAAHYLNIDTKDTCLNSEYPPCSTAWAETQSMFLDTMFSSIEWKVRYAKNKEGKIYPFELFKRKLEKIHILSPLDMNGISFVANFEKRIYESKKLTISQVKDIAKWSFKKYFDFKVDSLLALNVPHIYSWESACSYHGYGLAELAVAQWREYFYRKYGYIVDNPKIYKEMSKVWCLGSSKTFQQLLKLATGRKLTPKPYLRSVTRSLESSLRLAKQRLVRMKRVPIYNKKVNLNAKIRMVHGKKVIADNSQNFETMARKYKTWLRKN